MSTNNEKPVSKQELVNNLAAELRSVCYQVAPEIDSQSEMVATFLMMAVQELGVMWLRINPLITPELLNERLITLMNKWGQDYIAEAQRLGVPTGEIKETGEFVPHCDN